MHTLVPHPLRPLGYGFALAAALGLAACSGNMTGAATPPISQQSVASNAGTTYGQGAMSGGAGMPVVSPTPTNPTEATAEAAIEADPTPVALPQLGGVGGTLTFLPRVAASASPAVSTSPGASPAPSGGPAATASPAATGLPAVTGSPASAVSPSPLATSSAPAASGSPEAASAQAASAEPATILGLRLRIMPTDAPARDDDPKAPAAQAVLAVHLKPTEADATLAGLRGVALTMPENAFTAGVHTTLALYEINSGKKKKKAPTLLAIDPKPVFAKGLLKVAPATPVSLRAGHAYEIVLFADQALIVSPLGSASPRASGASSTQAGALTPSPGAPPDGMRAPLASPVP